MNDQDQENQNQQVQYGEQEEQFPRGVEGYNQQMNPIHFDQVFSIFESQNSLINKLLRQTTAEIRSREDVFAQKIKMKPRLLDSPQFMNASPSIDEEFKSQPPQMVSPISQENMEQPSRFSPQQNPEYFPRFADEESPRTKQRLLMEEQMSILQNNQGRRHPFYQNQPQQSQYQQHQRPNTMEYDMNYMASQDPQQNYIPELYLNNGQEAAMQYQEYERYLQDMSNYRNPNHRLQYNPLPEQMQPAIQSTRMPSSTQVLGQPARGLATPVSVPNPPNLNPMASNMSQISIQQNLQFLQNLQETDQKDVYIEYDQETKQQTTRYGPIREQNIQPQLPIEYLANTNMQAPLVSEPRRDSRQLQDQGSATPFERATADQKSVNNRNPGIVTINSVTRSNTRIEPTYDTSNFNRPQIPPVLNTSAREVIDFRSHSQTQFTLFEQWIFKRLQQEILKKFQQFNKNIIEKEKKAKAEAYQKKVAMMTANVERMQAAKKAKEEAQKNVSQTSKQRLNQMLWGLSDDELQIFRRIRKYLKDTFENANKRKKVSISMSALQQNHLYLRIKSLMRARFHSVLIRPRTQIIMEKLSKKVMKLYLSSVRKITLRLVKERKQRLMVRIQSDMRESFIKHFVRKSIMGKVPVTVEKIKEMLRKQFVKIFVKKIRVNKEIIFARLRMNFRRKFIVTRRPTLLEMRSKIQNASRSIFLKKDGIINEDIVLLKLRIGLWDKFVRPKKIMSVEDTLTYMRKIFYILFVVPKPPPSNEQIMARLRIMFRRMFLKKTVPDFFVARARIKLIFRKLFVRSIAQRSIKNIKARLRIAFMMMFVRPKKVPTPEEILEKIRKAFMLMFVIPKSITIQSLKFQMKDSSQIAYQSIEIITKEHILERLRKRFFEIMVVKKVITVKDIEQRLREVFFMAFVVKRSTVTVEDILYRLKYVFKKFFVRQKITPLTIINRLREVFLRKFVRPTRDQVKLRIYRAFRRTFLRANYNKEMSVGQKAVQLKIRQAFKRVFLVEKKEQLCLFAIRVKMKRAFYRMFVKPSSQVIMDKLRQKLRSKIIKIYLQRVVKSKLERYLKGVFKRHFESKKVGQIQAKIMYLIRQKVRKLYEDGKNKVLKKNIKEILAKLSVAIRQRFVVKAQVKKQLPPKAPKQKPGETQAAQSPKNEEESKRTIMNEQFAADYNHPFIINFNSGQTHQTDMVTSSKPSRARGGSSGTIMPHPYHIHISPAFQKTEFLPQIEDRNNFATQETQTAALSSRSDKNRQRQHSNFALRNSNSDPTFRFQNQKTQQQFNQKINPRSRVQSLGQRSNLEESFRQDQFIAPQMTPHFQNYGQPVFPNQYYPNQFQQQAGFPQNSHPQMFLQQVQPGIYQQCYPPLMFPNQSSPQAQFRHSSTILETPHDLNRRPQFDLNTQTPAMNKTMTPLTKTRAALSQIDDYKQMLNQFLVDNPSVTNTEMTEEDAGSGELVQEGLIDISERVDESRETSRVDMSGSLAMRKQGSNYNYNEAFEKFDKIQSKRANQQADSINDLFVKKVVNKEQKIKELTKRFDEGFSSVKQRMRDSQRKLEKIELLSGDMMAKKSDQNPTRNPNLSKPHIRSDTAFSKNIIQTDNNIFGSKNQDSEHEKEVLKTHTYLLKKQTMFKMKDVDIPSVQESAQSFISQNLINEQVSQPKDGIKMNVQNFGDGLLSHVESAQSFLQKSEESSDGFILHTGQLQKDGEQKKIRFEGIMVNKDQDAPPESEEAKDDESDTPFIFMGLKRSRPAQQMDFTKTENASDLKKQENTFDFLDMESCKISGMTSSFKSGFNQPYQQPKFSDVESEEFWKQASYKTSERNSIDQVINQNQHAAFQGMQTGHPPRPPLKIKIKKQSSKMLDRLSKFINTDNGSSDRILINSNCEVQEIRTAKRFEYGETTRRSDIKQDAELQYIRTLNELNHMQKLTPNLQQQMQENIGPPSLYSQSQMSSYRSWSSIPKTSSGFAASYRNQPISSDGSSFNPQSILLPPLSKQRSIQQLDSQRSNKIKIIKVSAQQPLTKSIQMNEKQKFKNAYLNKDLNLDQSNFSPERFKNQNKEAEKIFNKSPHMVVKKTKIKPRK